MKGGRKLNVKLDTKTPYRGENLVGQRSGKLTVTRYAGKNADKRRGSYFYWHTKCECGKTRLVNGRDIRYLVVKSCGCARPVRAMQTLGEGW